MTESKSSCVCIVGSSGSGKTTLVKHLTKGRRTYIINSQGEYSNPENEEISWEDASTRKLENCNLIFEDLIGVRSKDTKLIKKFVHYLLRRKNIKLYLLAHEIHNTGLFSLVNCMDYIYVTSGKKNAKILKDLKRLINYEPGTPANFNSLEHHYLKINVTEEKSEVLNAEFEPAAIAAQDNLDSKRAAVLSIVECLPEAEILMKLFDLIFAGVEPDILHPDLCVDLTARRAKAESSRVHIVDFLAALRSKHKPSHDIKRLKKYIDKKGVVIPQLLIINDYLLSN